MAWTDLLFKKEGSNSGKSEPVPSALVQDSSPGATTPFPKLSIPVLTSPQGAPPPATPMPAPAASAVVEGTEIEDPHLEKVVQLVRTRVHTLAGTSYQQFNAVRERMQLKLQPDQHLNLSLVCAAINASGRELAAEVSVMEQGLQTAELEVRNEIDAEERNAISGLESEIGVLDGMVSSRQTQIANLEQQLQTLRGEQLTDQRLLTQKQGQLRQQQATFAASRQRLKAARTRVAQDLAGQKRTFLGL
jgi:hypothetical protein